MSGAWDLISRAACRPGEARHGDVEDADVGPVGEGLLEGLDAVGRLGHDLHVGLAIEQQPQAAADDAVVVGDQDAHSYLLISAW